MRPRQMKALLDQLPKANQYVLYFIIQHLVNVAKHDEENKMGINNLAIVFGPTLFRSKDESPVRLLSDVAFLRGCVETFIKDYEIVFSSIIPANERVPVNEHVSSTPSSPEENASKRKGVSMNDSESLTQERNHLRFLLDKIAEDTKREEMETGKIGKRVKRDVESNLKHFEIADQQLKLMIAEEEKEQSRLSIQKQERHESTSPSEARQESEEEFLKSLEEIPVDLENPLEGISERIFRKMKRQNLPINQEIDCMSLLELHDEKRVLKRELRHFDVLYKKQHGAEPEKINKEPLRPLYNRYRQVRSVISQREKAAKNSAMNPEPVAEYVSATPSV